MGVSIRMVSRKSDCRLLRREAMKDQVYEIDEVTELTDDLVEEVAGGSGHVLDPNG